MTKVLLLVAAVRIGRSPLIAAGFADGDLHPAQELQAFVIGDRAPCWVSPTDATRFTLVRRPSVSQVAGICGTALSALLLITIARATRPGAAEPAARRRRKRSRRD